MWRRQDEGGRNGDRPKEEKRGPFPCSLCRIMQEAGITPEVQVSRRCVYLGRIAFRYSGGRSALSPRSHISRADFATESYVVSLIGGHQTRVSSHQLLLLREEAEGGVVGV